MASPARKKKKGHRAQPVAGSQNNAARSQTKAGVSSTVRHARAIANAEPGETPHPHGALGGLMLGATGIVFGDIGTSPLYAFKECIHGPHGVAATRENVLGVLSLIVWSLTLVVTVKYLTFVMRADNRGEGGIFSLLALTPERMRGGGRKIGVVALLVIAGAGLLYGDGMITPAISVLSAMEGLGTEAPGLVEYIGPSTCAILLGLFSIQSHGTERVGRLFGPIMVLWFGTLAVLGAYHLAKNPAVLAAVNPRHAFAFFATHKLSGITVLGSVVLAVTGGEALYADMGHFGARPIRLAWLCLVFPSLLLAYFGMGALVLADPTAAANPFYAMVPSGPATYALVGLATAAAIIASQAMISGAFSLTNQAVQLGFFPRVTIKHTSDEAEGQIYVPQINWLLAAACIALVLWAGSSTKLAAAYGIAVTGTMTITSILFFVVARNTWKWPLVRALPLVLFFLAFDIPFLIANAAKLLQGGYIPVVIAAGFFSVMAIWRRGRRMLAEALADRMMPVDEFLSAYGLVEPQAAGADARCQFRIHGTAVVMASRGDGIPPLLTHHLDRLHVLHEKVLLLTIVTAHTPYVPRGRHSKIETLGGGLYRMSATYGFMETPDVPELLREAQREGLEVDIKDVTYFVGRETILGLATGNMGEIEETFFALLTRNSRPATAHFRLPPGQIIEIGTQIDL